MRKVVLLWFASLVFVGAVASGLTAAAQNRLAPPPELMMMQNMHVLSGDDIGFRVERMRDGVPVGKVVVRVDGRWVDADSPMRAAR